MRCSACDEVTRFAFVLHGNGAIHSFINLLAHCKPILHRQYALCHRHVIARLEMSRQLFQQSRGENIL